MAGYIRVDTINNIADGNIINADDLDGEFDGVQAAFNSSTGHNHDGTTGEGAPILALGPTQDVTISSSILGVKTTNTVDIGSNSLKFKDLYLAGNASIGGTLSITGVATLTAQPVLSSLTASQAVFTNGSKGLVSNAITGTGDVVMSTSPTLVTPALGTPSSVTLTNATGLPVSTGISGLGTGVATLLATPSSANLAAAVTDETGSGSLVFSNSPTLVTPALGTPSSVTLTNATGLPVSTGISGLGTGVATFLATPSSSNLIAAVTDETGTGSLVFATSPTLVTPALGTPSSATLTNATGLPVSTGISGLGTSVATALAVNVGSAGAVVVNGGALGTPSSATLTNATGLPISTGVSGLGTSVATALAVNVGSAGAFVVNGGALGTPSSGTVTNLTGTASININGTVGATTATTGAFTSVTATSVTNSGLTSGRVTFASTAGLLADSANFAWSGTALNVTGTVAVTGAVTATLDSTFSSTGALTISKGTTLERPTAVSGMLRFNTTTTEFEGYNGTTWSSVGGAGLSNDTSTATNVYPLFANATSGTASTLFTGNTKLLYKPSTGDLTATAHLSSNGMTLNATTVSTTYSIPSNYNAMSAGPVSVNSGVTVTIPTGSVWTVI